MSTEHIATIKRRIVKDSFTLKMIEMRTSSTEQKEGARKIVTYLLNGATLVLCTAEPQAGKTQTMFETMMGIIENPIFPNVSFEKLFVITGLSSTSWTVQTKERFPQEMSGNIFHRNELEKKFIPKVRDLKDCYIFIDEVQIAVRKNQTLDKVLKSCGLNDIDFMEENNIKVILFSATPNGVEPDMADWDKHSECVRLQPGNGYTSNQMMLDNDRMFQFESFEKKGAQNVKYISRVFDEIRKSEEEAGHPLIHCIRLPKKCKDERASIITGIFKKEFIDADFIYLRADKGNISDFDDILSSYITPLKSKFVFIVESYRCAKTIQKKHVGVWVERYALNQGFDVAVQGNRLVGYDTPSYSRIFTNLQAITAYYNLKDNGCDNSEWRSNSTRVVNGTTTSKGTALSTPDGVFHDAIEETHIDDVRGKPIITIKIDTLPEKEKNVFTSLTEQKSRIKKSDREAVEKELKNMNIGIDMYSTYVFGCWKMIKNASRSKWGKEKMLKVGAKTTPTNLSPKEQKTDLLRVYIDYDYVFICPWNGTA